MSFPAYPNYRHSGVEWLGEVPAHWSVHRISELYREVAEPGHDELPILSVSIHDGVSDDESELDDECRKVNRSEDRAKYKQVRPNDLVYNMMRAWQGGFGSVRVSGMVSPAYVIARPKNGAPSRLIELILRTAGAIEEMRRHSKGITGFRLRLYWEEFRNMRIALPPAREQLDIIRFLSRETAKIDVLVDEQRRLISLLREKRQAVISQAVTRGLNPKAPMKASGIEWLGEVPAHWEVKRIRFVCHIGTGDADTADATEDGEYPFFVRSPIVERIGNFTHNCEAVLTAGDGAGVGKIYHHYEGKFRAHQRVYIFSKFEGVHGRFFYHYLAHMFAKVVLEGTAKSTVDSLRRPMIADFWMTVPPEVEQAVIIAAVEAASERFDALATEAEAAVKLLEERRAGLISGAVTGKIDVRSSAEILRLPVDRAYARGLIAAELIERSAHQATFGRVKLQKLAYLAETHISVTELGGAYLREAAGPLDREMISEMEQEASALTGIRVEQPNGFGSAVIYKLGNCRGAHRQELAALLGDRTAKFDKLIEDIGTIDTRGAEAIATLYAVWNDALIDGETPADMEIKLAVLTEWHPEKAKKFRLDELQIWLDWMRRHDLVPTGAGPKTSTGRLFA